MVWMLGSFLATCAALAVTLAQAANGQTAARADRWNAEDRAVLASLSLKRLAPVPVDPSNAVERLPAAVDLGKVGAEQAEERTRDAKTALNKQRAARPFLDHLYRPEQRWIAPPEPDTIVCRCEEVRAGEIRRLVTEQNCPGPNQLKSFVRCGMGPCQGRLCGLTAVEMIAESRGVPVSEVGYYRIRPPIKPVTIGDLATLDVPERSDAVHM